MKKTLLLLVACLIPHFASAQWDGTSAPWTQGTGTQSNPYQINTPSQLAYLSDMVNMGTSYAGQYFIMTADLDMNNISWLPIGDASHNFSGNFNGNGHSATNLVVNNENYTYAGLFGKIYNATIQGLTVSSSITGSHTYSGGIAGYSYHSTVNNCNVSGSLTGTGTYCGGIAGYSVSDTVVNCNVSANCSGSSRVGGIIGCADGIVITVCTINATNIGYNTNTDYAGGLVGHSSGTVSVTNCEINASMIRGNSYAGGTIGYSSGTASVTNCEVIVTGNISSISSYDAGGVIGYANASADVSNCEVIVTGNISSKREAGGVIGYAKASADVSNCKVRVTGNISSNDSSGAVGGVIGYANASANGSNCEVKVTGNISTGSSGKAGGVIGEAHASASVSGCDVNAGQILGSVCGGIIGQGSDMTDGSIQSCEFYGRINSTGVAGGIAGDLSCSGTIEISDCINHNVIQGTTYVGGIVGCSSDSAGTINLFRCANLDTVISSSTTRRSTLVGGIIGYVCGNGSAKLCYNRGNIEVIGTFSHGEHNHPTPNPCYSPTTSVNNYNAITVAFATGIGSKYSINTYSHIYYHYYGNCEGMVTCNYKKHTPVAGFVVQYCYNVGNINIPSMTNTTSSSSYTSSITYRENTIAGIGNGTTKCCYNAGLLTGGNYRYGIKYVGTVDNCYYQENCGGAGNGNSRTAANMKSLSFPIILNADSTVYVMDLFNENNGYPVFAYNTIYDITTDSVTNKTSYSAQLNGHCGGVADSVGFVYRLASSSDSVRVILDNGSSPAHFVLDSLEPNTSYTYRFFAIHNGQTVYGESVTFTTHPLYTLTIASNNSQWGSVLGGGSFAYGAATLISATPSTNYRFLNWSDGNQTNPRSYIVTQNETLTAIFGPDLYNITLTSNNNDWGTVSGGGTYTYGQMVLVNATPSQGYHFIGWSDGNSDNPRVLTVESDINLMATFAVNQYTVTIYSNDTTKGVVDGSGTFNYGQQTYIIATPLGNNRFSHWSDGDTNAYRLITVLQDISYTAIFTDAYYTVTALSNNDQWGTVTGSGSYLSGSNATLTATSAVGYHFAQWNDGNFENPRTVTVNGNAIYTAQFAPNIYVITAVSDDSTRGYVIGGGNYSYLTQVTMLASPMAHYHFSQWSDGITSNPRTITVTGDSTFIAQFAINQHTLSVISSDPDRGSVSGSGIYDYNSQVVISATAAEHYHFQQWSDGVTSNPRTVTVTGDITYTAQFAPDNYILTVTSSDNTMGYVSGGGTFAYGSEVSISAMPLPHHHFVQWSDGITTNPRTITVTGDSTFTAQFTIDQHTLTVVSSDPDRGSVSGSGIYDYNAQVIISATAAEHYHFLQWSDGVTSNPRTVTITGDIIYTAQFAPNNYILTVTSSDNTMGYVSGGGTFAYGSEVSISAMPLPHHYFVQWSDSITTNPRTITVTNDSTITAQFAEETQYTITVISDDSTRGSVSGGGRFYAGEQTTLMASAAANHLFSHWNDGSTEALHTVTVVEDATYTAYFEPVTYTVNVFSNDDNMGSVSGGGNYAYGQPATVTATPAAGYRFVRWSNGMEANPYTFTVYSDVNLIANFERTTGIGEVVDDDYTVITHNLDLFINGAEGHDVIVCDIVGRTVYSSTRYDGKPIGLPTTGVYLLRIDNRITKKIVLVK